MTADVKTRVTIRSVPSGLAAPILRHIQLHHLLDVVEQFILFALAHRSRAAGLFRYKGELKRRIPALPPAGNGMPL